MKQRDKKKYIIVGLCAIVAIMAVGYAAFSSQLTINGTSEIASNWCLGFDSTKTNTYVPSARISGGIAPTGSIGFDGNVCDTSYKTVANLSASFKQPGDKIVYTLTIANRGSLNAAIKSIIVDGDSVTSNTTKTKGNITFRINMPESTSIAVGGTTTMTVEAKFQNERDITGPYTQGEEESIEVLINAEQDDGNGGMNITPATFTGSIYRWSTTQVKNGDSIGDTTNVWCEVAPTYQGYCEIHNEYGNSCDSGFGFYTLEECNSDIQYAVENGYIEEGSTRCEQGTVSEYNSCDNSTSFSTKEECESDIDMMISDGYATDGQYTCSQKSIPNEGIGEYTTDASTLNKNYYLKHDVVDNIITASYACFVTDKEYCMRGVDPSHYAANKTIIQGQESWFTGQSGSCNFGDVMSSCESSTLKAEATSDGDVYTGGSSGGICGVSPAGNSDCYVSASEGGPVGPRPGENPGDIMDG